MKWSQAVTYQKWVRFRFLNVMKVWQVEQAVTEVLNRLRVELQKQDREKECEGAVLRVIVAPELKVSTEFKLIHAVGVDHVEASHDSSVVSEEVASVRR